jgi:NAD(P)-dependent dehydrogenase (short-subunit alcohol dehydrogenase family)
VLAELSRRGDSVVAVDREPAKLDIAIAALGGRDRHLGMAEADLVDPSSADRIIAAALARYGRIDGVVHTVGGFASAPLARSDPSAFEGMFRLNVITTLNVFRATADPMRKARKGCLIAIGAGAAVRAPAGLSAYAAAKAGVLRLVESFADELKSEGVRVNAVAPSIIDTPQNRAAMPDADHASWVPPDRLAATIAFLVSDEGSAITGATIPVTGRT